MPFRRMTMVAVVCLALVAATTSPAARVASRDGVCGTTMARYRDGSLRPIVTPPAPRISVRALSKRTFEFRWTFAALPAKCRPVMLSLGVQTTTPGRAWFVHVDAPKRVGTRRLTVPSFMTPTKNAFAFSYMSNGARSARVDARISG